MEWLKNKIHRFAVSILTGMVAVLLACGSGGDKCIPEITAWWGVLYPGFCFSGKKAEIDKNEEAKEQVDIKISFWLAKALDW